MWVIILLSLVLLGVSVNLAVYVGIFKAIDPNSSREPLAALVGKRIALITVIIPGLTLVFTLLFIIFLICWRIFEMFIAEWRGYND